MFDGSFDEKFIDGASDGLFMSNRLSMSLKTNQACAKSFARKRENCRGARGKKNDGPQGIARSTSVPEVSR